jgi:CheY-like chemotaxis protein
MSSLGSPAREMTSFRDTGTRRKPCVLLADDDDDLRELMALLLGEAGFMVRTASNGEEALQILAHLEQRELPDAIVLDLMMPVKTGWEVLEQLRLVPAHAAIPVLVISAAHDLARAKSLGAARVIRKPLEVERLPDAVVSCLVPREAAASAVFA